MRVANNFGSGVARQDKKRIAAATPPIPEKRSNMKAANTLSYYRHRADEARSRAEAAHDPSIRAFFETLCDRYQNIAANLAVARRPKLSLRITDTSSPCNTKKGRRSDDYAAR